MAKYRVELTRSAEKTLFKLPKAVLPKILAALQGLAFDPFPAGCRKLSGEQDTFRIRVQNYRIIYEVYSEMILVKVLKIGHRKDIYR
jgi:mRNA interferase RelE/StbE